MGSSQELLYVRVCECVWRVCHVTLSLALLFFLWPVNQSDRYLFRLMHVLSREYRRTAYVEQSQRRVPCVSLRGACRRRRVEVRGQAVWEEAG